MSRFFENVPLAPPDAIFNLTTKFKADTDPKALNLGVGAYRDENGKPWVLPVVKEAEKILVQQLEAGEINHEYLPISGLDTFVKESSTLAIGADSAAVKEGRVGGVQCISGTGSLRAIGEFISKFNDVKTILTSNPTWGNHKAIFTACGLTVEQYRYWDKDALGLNLTGMLEDLKAAPSGATVILHACAHNPTGVDPTEDQWKEISAVCKEKNFTVIFDAAYVGFASGSVEEDCRSYRMFVGMNIPVFICQSYSKNFGLYNERTGAVVVATNAPETTQAVISQLKILVRCNWSNPPAHGAQIVAIVLSDEKLRNDWFECLQIMSSRIKKMRSQLKAALVAKGTPGTWDHITNQIGMFSFTGLTSEQVTFIQEKYHIYMLQNGRVNMCGLTEPTIDHLATAIHDAVTSSKL